MTSLVQLYADGAAITELVRRYDDHAVDRVSGRDFTPEARARREDAYAAAMECRLLAVKLGLEHMKLIDAELAHQWSSVG